MSLFSPPKISKLVEKQDIKGLAKAMRYEDVNRNTTLYRREKAVAGLLSIGNKQAFDALVTALKEHEGVPTYTSISGKIVLALQDMGDARAIDPIVGYLKLLKREKTNFSIEEDVNICISALVKLGWEGDGSDVGINYLIQRKQYEKCVQYGKAALGPLKDALREKQTKWSDLTKIEEALHKLGWKGDVIKEKVYGLLDAKAWSTLEKQGSIVQPYLEKAFLGGSFAAAKALEKMGTLHQFVESNPKTNDLFIRFLRGNDIEAKKFAIKILGELKEKKAIKPLIDILRSVKTKDEITLRNAATHVLGSFGEAALNDLYAFIDKSPEGDIYSAFNLIGKVGNDMAIDKLIDLLKHSKFPRLASDELLNISFSKLTNEHLLFLTQLDPGGQKVTYYEGGGYFGDPRRVDRVTIGYEELIKKAEREIKRREKERQ